MKVVLYVIAPQIEPAVVASINVAVLVGDRIAVVGVAEAAAFERMTVVTGMVAASAVEVVVAEEKVGGHIAVGGVMMFEMVHKSAQGMAAAGRALH